MTEIQDLSGSALRHQTWEMPVLLQSYVAWSKSITSGVSIVFCRKKKKESKESAASISL